jgi:hypothetical protein
MAGISNERTAFGDTANLDSFGRLRVSEPYTILDTKQIMDNLPLFYDDQLVSGSGVTSTYHKNRASSIMTVSANTAGKRVRQSKIRGTYQPGKSLLVLNTFVIGVGTSGVTKRMGYFDENNGLFLMQDGGTLSLVRRSFGSGSVVDTIYPQVEWNLDQLDGTGRSRVVLDITKTQILFIDMEWLGVGRVRFGFVIDGKVYYVHEINNANYLNLVYMSTPNLPIRYEIENDGTGAECSLEQICASIISEGGQQATVLQSYVSRNGTAFTLAAQEVYSPVISLRLKQSHIGTRISPVQVEIMATGSVNYEWRLLLNPTIAGTDTASWIPNSNSAVEYDISRTNLNVVTGGHILSGGYGASTNQSRSQITGITRSYLSIGTNIANESDELVLAIANIDGSGGTIYAGVVVDEYS